MTPSLTCLPPELLVEVSSQLDAELKAPHVYYCGNHNGVFYSLRISYFSFQQTFLTDGIDAWMIFLFSKHC